MVNFENNYERPVSSEAGQLNVFTIYVQSYGKGIFKEFSQKSISFS